MSRLPTPGSDDNTWGDILNDFLGVSINTDGTIKTGAVGSAQIADGSITTTDISSTAGIVKGQLASAVQTSLGKADSALQSVPNATSTSIGGIQLAGDLTGSATSPALATSGVTSGTYGSVSSIPVFTVDSKGRLTAAGTQAPSALQSYTTSNTTGSYLGQWTKIATLTVTSQYSDMNLGLFLQAYIDAESVGSMAQLRLRVKQNTAFGNNPAVDAAVYSSGGSLGASNIIAVITQNSPSSIVDYYLQINEGNRAYAITVNSVASVGSASYQCLSNQSFVTTGSLPAGNGQVAGKYDATNPASSTTTGGVRLTGDLGGTATAPTTPTAVHISGAETITGSKTFTGTVTVPSPVNTTDPTTKTYVDTAITNIGSGLTQASSQTASFTAATGKFYPVNATSGTVTVTLPTSSASQFFVVKKTDGSANVVTLSGTINGTASTTLSLTRQNQAKELIADGSGGWTVAIGDLDIVTTLATPTALGFVQLAGDLTGTAASPALAATAVTAGSYGSATAIPTFTVDTKGRLTAAGTQTPSALATYLTTSTYNAADVSKWTKIASQTILTQYSDAQAMIRMIAYGDNETTGSQAIIRLRTKQQAAFGNNPTVEIALVQSSGTLMPSNLMAIVIQNTPSTVVNFYIQISQQYRAYQLAAQSIANSDDSTTTLFAAQVLTATASLPAGTLQQAGKYDPTLPELYNVAISTTAPTNGQILQATSATTAAWTTVSTGGTTDNTKVAKSGDTMTGSLTMPNLNSIKTPAPSDIYQWFYSDSTAYNQVPFGELWHDLLAFNKLWSSTFETSNGSTWTSVTLNKKIFSHIEGQNIQIMDGNTIQGVRWTFTNAAYSTGRWLLIAYAYVASSPSVVIYVQSSSDGNTWTNRHNSSYTAGIAPVWHYVQDNGGDGYLRILITSSSAVNISGIRFYSPRWGDQGSGKELEHPYTWNENGYIGIGKGMGAPSYPLDVTGDANITGQIHNVTNPTSAQDVATKAYVDANVGSGGSAPDASSSTKGLVQLTNDLGGTATSPTTPTAVHLTGTETISGAKTFTNNVVLTATSPTFRVNNTSSTQYSSSLVQMVNTTSTMTGAAGVQFGAVISNAGATAGTLNVDATDRTGAYLYSLFTIDLTSKQVNFQGVINVNSNKIVNLATPTAASDAATKDYVDSKAAAGGSGITRTVSQISAATTAGSSTNIDYVYYWNGSTAYTLTMPTAASNTNRYTIKNASAVSQTVTTTSSQTIDGGTSIVIYAGNSVDLISNGSGWMVI